MKSGLAKNVLFAVLGVIVAGVFAVKPLYGLALTILIGIGYGLWVQAIYRQLNQRQAPIDGLMPQELQPAQLYYKRGRNRWDQGNYAGALGDFERAIADPDCFPEVYYQYGLLLLETGNAIDALRRLEQAAAIAQRSHEPELCEQARHTIERLRAKFPQLAYC
jgi:tetratricopeptide (TPR) repeat protein